MNNLPNELLINIFEYLPATDRLLIATVSKHWFNILQLPTFIKDNHIILHECIVNKKYPPLRTFYKNKRSRRTFPYLTLDNIKFDSGNLTDIKILFNILGKDVHHLTICLGFNFFQNPNFMTFFPNLKTLTLKDAKQLNSIEEPFPESLNTFIVTGLSHNFEFAFINKIPNLKTIYREDVNFYMLTNQIPKGFIEANGKLKTSLETIDCHAVIKTDLNYIGSQEICIEHINQLTCSGTKEKLLLIGKEFCGLKSLNFDLKRQQNDENCCFFRHEVIESFKSISLLNFTEREYETDQKLCEKCFEVFLDSFKNVSRLTMYTALNQKQLSLMFEKLTKLQSITIFSYNKENLYDFDVQSLPKIEKLKLWSNNNRSISDEILLKWPWMPNLNRLEIMFLPMKIIQSTSWIRLCRQCPSLVYLNHDCDKYCIDDKAFVLLTKLLPKLKHLSLKSAHKLTQISFLSLKNNCASIKTLKLGRNWIDTGLANSLFANLHQLQHFEWVDARTYHIEVLTRADYYFKAHSKVKSLQSNSKETDDDDSSSDDEIDKIVWGWIPNKGWGFWTKEQVKAADLEKEFDSRY